VIGVRGVLGPLWNDARVGAKIRACLTTIAHLWLASPHREGGASTRFRASCYPFHPTTSPTPLAYPFREYISVPPTDSFAPPSTLRTPLLDPKREPTPPGLTHRSHNPRTMADTEQHAEDTHDPQFEPVIRLTEQVESKTHEEDEEVVFKMCVGSLVPVLRCRRILQPGLHDLCPPTWPRGMTLTRRRAKLFRFLKDDLEWKERGTGDVRLLKHKETGKTRLVMRRDKTLKVCANHIGE